MAQNAQVKPGNACPHLELPVLVSCVFRKMSLGATQFPGPQIRQRQMHSGSETLVYKLVSMGSCLIKSGYALEIRAPAWANRSPLLAGTSHCHEKTKVEGKKGSPSAPRTRELSPCFSLLCPLSCSLRGRSHQPQEVAEISEGLKEQCLQHDPASNYTEIKINQE